MKMYRFGNCKVLPGLDGSCAQGYSPFKTKNGVCCRGIPYHDIGCPIYGTKRRFISPISKKCVTLRGKKAALAKLNKLRTGIVGPMSGDEDLGSYGTEAGIQFFGVKKRKYCDRRKKSCYRKKPSRFKKSKAPCGGMKRKTCRSTVGCSYVKKRGCRNRKNAAILVAGAVAGVEKAIEVVPEVFEAISKTANRAERLAIEAGAKPDEAAQVGVIAAGAQAVKEAKSVGVPKESLALVRQTAEQRAAANRAAYDALPAGSLERLDFGRRRSRFGTECKTLKDIESCVTYRDSIGAFPCNWSGGTNKWCMRRSNAITYNEVMRGKYADIIKNVVTPPVAPAATATAPSVSQKRVTEVCKGLDQVTCGQLGMCQWVNGERLKRCQARRGYGDKNWEGELPGAPARTAAEIAAEEARELMFGGFNISDLAKLAKKVKLPSAEKLKKLKSEVEKHANTLEKNYDKLNEIVNEKESDMNVKNEAEKFTTAFGKKHRLITYKKCSKKGSVKKLPTKIRKLCHKLKIKITKKVGRRRVYKKLSILKKQIAHKLRKLKKAEKFRCTHASR